MAKSESIKYIFPNNNKLFYEWITKRITIIKCKIVWYNKNIYIVDSSKYKYLYNIVQATL